MPKPEFQTVDLQKEDNQETKVAFWPFTSSEKKENVNNKDVEVPKGSLESLPATDTKEKKQQPTFMDTIEAIKQNRQNLLNALDPNKK